jgi:type II secretory pathway component GspD/PulD (secretin)
MKNKIREKFIAGVLLSAFMVTNTMTAGFAMEAYDGYGVQRPLIRGGSDNIIVNLKTDIEIPNADSIVNLSLRDADVKQVLRMFADQAGMNIIFTPDVDGEVTMDMVDIPLKEALDLVVKTSKLYYEVKANTLVVSSEGSALSLVDRNQNMTIIPVKYVNAAAIASFMNTNVFSTSGKEGSGSSTGVSQGDIVATNPANNELIVTGTDKDVALVRRIVEQFDKKPTITTIKVNHTTPAEMASLVCDSLFPSMTVGGGGSSTGGAAGVPTGFAAAAESSITVGGGQLACSLDAQDASGSSGNDYKLEGLKLMNLSVSYFPAHGTIQILGGSESQIEMIKDYIAENDKKTPQAYLEVQIIALSESGSKTFDNTWQFLSKNFSFNAGGGSGFSTNTIHPVFFAGKGYYVPDTESYDSSSGEYESSAHLTKWSTSPHLIYSVNYIVENSKGRVLANPKVLITNGKSSTIDLTSDYVSKVTSQYLDSTSGSGSAQVQKDYEISDDNGIKVEITPFISPDGYVTLDIKPDYKTIASRVYTGGETDEQDLAATLLQRRDLDLKGIRIKDGETLVIGGMIQETETKTVKKIPFLGDIPVLGVFFRSTGTEKAREEMVIMITPQIIVDTEDVVSEDTTL